MQPNPEKLIADKLNADRFIAERLSVYGLNGSNTLKNPDAGFPRSPFDSKISEGDINFLFGDHFKFGYNGEVGVFRKSSTCMYWTEHGLGRRPIESLTSEAKIAANEAAHAFGKLNLIYSGSAYCHGVLEAFASIPNALTVILPCDEEKSRLPTEVPDQLLKYGYSIKPVYFNWRDFELFLDKCSVAVRATDVKILFSHFFREKLDGVFVYENHLPRIVDMNFDRIQGKSVGPANWCLEEIESDMDVARCLMILGEPGVVDFFRSTPEILPAYVQTVFSNGNDPLPLYSKSTEIFSEKFESYEAGLVAKSPKAREAWHSPLSRLAKQWQILDKKFHQMNESCYGTVY